MKLSIIAKRGIALVPLQSSSQSPPSISLRLAVHGGGGGGGDGGNVTASTNPPSRYDFPTKQWTFDNNAAVMLDIPAKSDALKNAYIDVECFATGEGVDNMACGQVKIPLARLGNSRQPVEQWYKLDGQGAANGASLYLRLECIGGDFVPTLTPSGSERFKRNSLDTNSTPLTSATVSSSHSSQSISARNINNNNVTTTTTTATVIPQHLLNEKLPCGVADYFMIAGAGGDAIEDWQKQLSKSKVGMGRSARRSTLGSAIEDISLTHRQDSVFLPPCMIERYPQTDRADVEFPPSCEAFLFPDGVEVTKTQWDESSSRRCFTFVHKSGLGVKIYGFCMEVQTVLAQEAPTVANTQDGPLYSSLTLCYLTRFPFEAMFRKALLQTFAVYENHDKLLELVSILTDQIPTPLPGVLRSTILLPHVRLTCSLPKPGDFQPLLFPGICNHVMKWFGVDQLIRMWASILVERKIIVHSTNRACLALVTESLAALMHPFQWEGPYIPVLPRGIHLYEIIQSPVPCILGVRTDVLKSMVSSATALDDWVVIDADRCTVKFHHGGGHGVGGGISNSSSSTPAITKGLHRRLARMLREISRNVHLSQADKDRSVRLAFLECLVALLQGYRECLFYMQEGSAPIFNKVQFLMRHEQSDGAEFLSRLFETQAFERFKMSQESPELALFHTCYAMRRSRERERDQRAAALQQLKEDPEYQTVDCVPTGSDVLRDLRWTGLGLETLLDVVVGVVDGVPMPSPTPPPLSNTNGTVPNNNTSPVAELVLYCKPILDDKLPVSTPFGDGVVIVNNEITPHTLCVTLGWGAKVFLADVTTLRMHVRSIMPNRNVLMRLTVHGIQPTLADAIRAGNNTADVKSITLALKELARMYNVSSFVCPNGGPQLGQQDAVKKTAMDREVERALQRALTHVFFDRAIPEAEITACAQYVETTLHARDVLSFVLASQRQQQNAPSEKWLAVPGRGRSFGADAFASLIKLFDALLTACLNHEDYSNAREALAVSPFYSDAKNLSDTVQAHLKGHLLWQKVNFWEYSFAESLAQDRATTPEAAAILQDPDVKWNAKITVLWSLGRRKPEDDPKEYNKLLFDTLSTTLLTMLSLGVEEDKARVLVVRVVEEYSLDAEQDGTLNTLVTNFARAVSFANEEQAPKTKEMSPENTKESPKISTKRKRFSLASFQAWRTTARPLMKQFSTADSNVGMSGATGNGNGNGGE